MASEVRLNDLEDVLEGIDYPVGREDAVAEFSDVTLSYADGEENLGEVVERTGSDRFESVTELEDEIYGVLPREAVGEPYQSEGEG